MAAEGALITTKLYRPHPPGRWIARARLAARLEAGIVQGCPLILVIGPAGFGKTTLVSSWLASLAERQRENRTASPSSSSNAPSPPQVAWLSLEPGDDEPGRFLRYLLAALRQIEPTLESELLPLLRSGPPYDDLLTALVNALAARTNHSLLVLDDAQHLKRSEALAALTFLVEHVPPLFHLVLCSREDPPLPLARLRAHRQLCEIRQQDLRCTFEEAETFLRESMGLHLARDAVALLTQRTEGWFAGLQLAGLSLQQQSDPAPFLKAFGGTDRYVLDYLIDEVYSGQPPEIRELLLRAAVLARFCAPLCDALLAVPVASAGMPGPPKPHAFARAALAQIERANLFIVPLDTTGEWYRFHHLFAELLRHRLELERGPGFVATLHQAASAWFEEHGLLLEAMEHIRASGDWPAVADLAERHGIELLEHSEVHLLAEWCAAIPEPVVRARPRLCVLYAWALTLDLRNDCRARAEDLLRAAEQATPGADQETQRWLAGHLAVLRGHLQLLDPAVDPVAVIESGRRALELLPTDAGSVRAVAALRVAYGYLGLAEAETAWAAFDAAEQIALESGTAYAVVSCAFDRARIALLQGDPSRARAAVAAGRERLERELREVALTLPAVASLEVIEGCVTLEEGDADHAERLLDAGLRVIGRTQQFALTGYPALARARAARGDGAGAEAALRQIAQIWPESATWAEGLRHWYGLLLAPDDERRRAAAEAWAEANVPDPDALPRLPGIGKSFDETRYGTWLAWARIRVALGRLEGVIPLIERLLAHAETQRLGGRARELREALIAARHADPDISSLPVEVLDDRSSGYAMQHSKGYSIEPLSERELDVLRLLVEEPSYSAIARQLVVSPNTVKSHIRHIYEKLGVSNRREALARARALGLLSNMKP